MKLQKKEAANGSARSHSQFIHSHSRNVVSIVSINYLVLIHNSLMGSKLQYLTIILQMREQNNHKIYIFYKINRYNLYI